MFLIAAASFLWYSVLETNDKQRTNHAIAIYIIAFIFFTLSGLLEFAIDAILTKLGESRTQTHARYSSKNILNIVISVIFIIGNILDLSAFFMWQSRNFALEKHVIFASAHTWLLSAILSISGIVNEIDSMDISDILISAGNALFFIGSVIDCIVRYLDNDAPKAEDDIKKLEFSSSPFWLANALCFLVADIMRLAHLGKQKRKKEKSCMLEQVGQLSEEFDTHIDPTESEHKADMSVDEPVEEEKGTERYFRRLS